VEARKPGLLGSLTQNLRGLDEFGEGEQGRRKSGDLFCLVAPTEFERDL
jgi:hypothetical protein